MDWPLGIGGSYQFSIDLGAIADDGVELVHEDDRDRDLALPEFRELRTQHLKPQLHVGGKSYSINGQESSWHIR